MKSLKSLLAKHTLTGHPNTDSSSSSSRSKQAPPPEVAPPVPVTRAPEPAHVNPQHQQQDYAQPATHMPTAAAMSPAQSSSQAQSNSASAAAAAAAAQQKSVEQAEALIKRDNEAKARRLQEGYEGLPEGITLGTKMGDGAFSNVFAATLKPNRSQLAIDPTLTETVKVAVKCVRKFELNQSQVREPSILRCLWSRSARVVCLIWAGARCRTWSARARAASSTRASKPQPSQPIAPAPLEHGSSGQGRERLWTSRFHQPQRAVRFRL